MGGAPAALEEPKPFGGVSVQGTLELRAHWKSWVLEIVTWSHQATADATSVGGDDSVTTVPQMFSLDLTALGRWNDRSGENASECRSPWNYHRNLMEFL